MSTDRFEIDADARSHFAWLRTAASLIAFGFAIFQFFEWMRESQGIASSAQSHLPRYVGVLLLVAGIATLVVSAWQYRKMERYLWGPEFSRIAGIAKAPLHSPLLGVTIVLIVIAIVALGAVIYRLG